MNMDNRNLVPIAIGVVALILVGGAAYAFGQQQGKEEAVLDQMNDGMKDDKDWDDKDRSDQMGTSSDWKMDDDHGPGDRMRDDRGGMDGR